MCQKQHGAASGTCANIARAGLTIERGESVITEYASSEHARRAFCTLCGSTLFWRSEESPDRIAVTLDTPLNEPVEIEVYADQKPVWLPVRDPS